MKKFVSIIFVMVVLSTSVFTITSSAVTCNSKTKHFKGETYKYSEISCPCSNPACVSNLVCTLKSTNNATSKFSSLTGYPKSAYVKLTRANGKYVEANSGTTKASYAIANKNPVFFIPASVVHKGECNLGEDLCTGDHIYKTYKD